MTDKEDETSPRVKVFKGRQNEDYSIWRDRIEVALDMKGYWDELQDLKNALLSPRRKQRES